MRFDDLIGASTRGGWGPESDDRHDADSTMAFVADGRGPSYGGYHAPFALDPGLEALRDALPELRAAFAAADAKARALEAEHADVLRARGAEGDGLKRALEAADAVRPARWSHLHGRSYAHFTLSLTACVLQGSRLVIGHIGAGRVYRLREDVVERLVTDHTLASAEHAQGKPFVLADRAVVLRFLGSPRPTAGGEVEFHELDARAGDRLLLCTDGVWGHARGEEQAHALLRASSRAEVEALVSSAADESGDDAAVARASIT